jgi:hypothetical protein
MFKVGDTVKIRRIDGNYETPYVGRTGTITKVAEQEPENHYQVELIGEPQATLTLFDNELLIVD